MVNSFSNPCLKVTPTLCFIILILSTLIYFSIYFTVYDPYFSINWNDSKCIVEQIQKYQLRLKTDDKDEVKYLIYSLFLSKVIINNRWHSAFGCGVSKSQDLDDVSDSDIYTYKHAECPQPERCGSMLILPLWFCHDCDECTQFLDQKGIDCIWSFRNANVIEDVDELPLGYELEYPMKSAPFVQIVIGDDAYYNKDSYISMQVILLGFLMVLPGICSTFSCILLLIRYFKR